MIREDVLQVSKNINISIPKEVFLACKIMLFKYDITMAKIVEEFIILLTHENKYARKIFEKALYRKLEKTINRKFERKNKHKLPKKILTDKEKEVHDFKDDIYATIEQAHQNKQNKNKDKK